VVFFKPQGVPLGQLRGVSLDVEGLEAMRLVDAEGLSQEEAAARMRVSRPTLCRVLGAARSAVARALSNGWAIRIEGGVYALEDEAEETRAAERSVDESVIDVAPCESRRRCCGREREDV
jgi:predicted DNA-binding protein (UPF0251 family)